MDKVLEFIKTNDKNIDKQTYIEISFGKFIDPKLAIFNTNITQKKIKEFIDYLIDYLKINNKKIRHGERKSKIYYWKHLQLHSNTNNLQVYLSKVNQFESIILQPENSFGINCKLIKKCYYNLENFSSQKDYQNIINRNIITIYYDDLVNINIINDISDNNINYNKITITITKENIFIEKVYQTIKNLIEIIDKFINL